MTGNITLTVRAVFTSKRATTMTMPDVYMDLSRIAYNDRVRIKQFADGIYMHTSLGEVSDGYHTFNELYDYRMALNAALFNEWQFSDNITVCKSKKHSDGELVFGGEWFIVVAELPTGQISFHYEEKHWDLFNIPEVELSPTYDGHTPQEALERLIEFVKQGHDDE